MSDAAMRDQALDPRASFIVQAPAGSGKTQLLTARILSLLATRVSAPESILAITFTRKAANEMKQRVMDALKRAQQPEPSKAHEQTMWRLARAVLAKDTEMAWGLLENPQRLRIMTIDAFCASLARQLPLTSRLGVGAEPVDNAEALYLEAAHQTLQQALNNHNADIETLLLHINNDQEALCERIAKMLSTREQWLAKLYLRDEDETNMDQIRHVLESYLSEELDACFLQATEVFADSDTEALSLYVGYASSHLSDDALTVDLDSPTAMRHLCQWLSTSTGQLRKTVRQEQGFPAPSAITDKGQKAQAKAMKEGMCAWLEDATSHEILCEAIVTLSGLPEPKYPDTQWAVLKALFLILKQAVIQLHLLFMARGQTDFTEITRCASDALGDDDQPTDLDLKLDYALQHVLIDEFQDTSVAQYALIEKLVRNWDNSGEKTLFLVGDPMQSIYLFRQADVTGFLRAQRDGMGPITLTPLYLTSNFRSEAPIIEWINAQMPRVFSPIDDALIGAVKYASFEANHAASERSDVYHHLNADLQHLKTLVADPSLKSIAVLVRTRSHLTEVLTFLKAEQIAFQAVEIDPIAETPCIRQLFQLTLAYLNRADHLAWTSVLLGPYIGLTLDDLTRIKEGHATYYDGLKNGDALDGLSLNGKKILKRVAPILIRAVDDRYRDSLPRAIEQLWYALGGPASLPDTTLLNDAAAYFDLLHVCDRGGDVDCHELEARLEGLFSKAGQHAKVQLMTVHKSKGLEFDAVLIPRMEGVPKASDKPLLVWEGLLVSPIHPKNDDHDPLYQYIWNKRSMRERHEAVRLLYVGLTRARKQLHLFGEAGNVSRSSFQGLLSHTMISSETIAHEQIPLEQAKSRSFTRIHSDWTNPFQVPDVAFPENPMDMDKLLPHRFDDRAWGTLIHAILYHWAEQPRLMKTPILEQSSFVRALMWEHGVHLDEEARVYATLQRIQSDPNAQYLLDVYDDAQNEYEMTTVSDGVTTIHRIDRTFVDKQQRRVIVDYKTGDFDPGHWQQLRAYATVLAARESRPITLCLYFPMTGDYRVEEA